MPPVDPRNTGHLETANGNGTGHRSAPGNAPAALLAQPAVAEPMESPAEVGQDEPPDVPGSPADIGPARAGAASEASGLEPAVTDERPLWEGGSTAGDALPPDRPPGTAEFMPRHRAGHGRSRSRPARKGKAAKDPAKVVRPKGARGAASEERQEGHAWLAQQSERARSLPARRGATEPRRGGYVMGTANLCRSCGSAVWLAGKDAGGHWVKVNLDGSPHICGAPMTGLGRFPMPLALPPGPQTPPPVPYNAAPSLGPAPQPVADQGRVWVERFMGGVALVALLFLATIPRDLRTGPSAPRDPPQQAAVQRAAATPAAAAPAAKPEAPRKDTFSLGSTEDDVMAVMGPPREIHDDRWWYGSSYLDFRNNRVVNFYNSIHGELKVKMQGAARTRSGSLGKGLTKDEVLSLQGTPTRLAGNRWYYGSSYVDFRDERVADYFNGVLRELKLPNRSATQ